MFAVQHPECWVLMGPEYVVHYGDSVYPIDFEKIWTFHTVATENKVSVFQKAGLWRVAGSGAGETCNYDNSHYSSFVERLFQRIRNNLSTKEL